MARDPDTIQRDIEEARDALAATLDQLADRAHPRRFVESGKQAAHEKMTDPRVKYAAIAVGGLIALLVVRSLFR